MEKETYLRRHADMLPSHPFLVATNIRDHPGQWKPLDQMKVEDVDHYTIRPNEVVFDVDFPDWRYTYTSAGKLLLALKKRDVEPSLYLSGGRGVHLHCRFEIETDDLRYADFFRSQFAFYVVKDAGILSWYGKGRPIDAGPVKFSSLKSGHLVRAPGGRKGKRFKSYFTSLPNANIAPNRLEDVEIEEWIPLFEAPDYHDNYVKKKEEWERREEPQVNLEKGYMQLPCIKKILKGRVRRGSRNNASKVLAIAAYLDGVEDGSFLTWTRQMASHFEDKKDYDFGEATAWKEWAGNTRATWWCEDAQAVKVRDPSTGEVDWACVRTCPFFRRKRSSSRTKRPGQTLAPSLPTTTSP